jgi:phosphoribosylglycinamide formyltransferase-1
VKPGAGLPLAIVISGRGSNMLAIARACAANSIGAQVARGIAERDEAAGRPAARELGLATSVVAARGHAERAGFEAALQAEIDASGARLVVLAGFMRILSPAFTAAYAGRLLNIHPSLLPGYPGLRTHERVLAAGETEHGASVHFVTAELDGGPVVLQGRVPVLAGDTVASLSARVQRIEHIIYPQAIGWVAAGRLALRGGVAQLDGLPIGAPPLAGEAAVAMTATAPAGPGTGVHP